LNKPLAKTIITFQVFWHTSSTIADHQKSIYLLYTLIINFLFPLHQ